MGSRRCVMHLMRNTGFHLTSPEIWLNSPNGPSSAVQPIGKSSPSKTSSASAGTSRSTVLHFASGTGLGGQHDAEHLHPIILVEDAVELHALRPDARGDAAKE